MHELLHLHISNLFHLHSHIAISWRHNCCSQYVVYNLHVTQ
jgi:hypothetical protein